MSVIQAQRIVEAMKHLEMQAQGKNALANPVDNGSEKFSTILMRQLDYVNQAQIKSEDLQDRFTMGDPDVSLVDTKVAELKASIGTAGIVEFRNKLLEAYNSVMNMPV